MFESIQDAMVWWTPNVRILDQPMNNVIKKSKASPALAVFQGKLHMVHLGDSSNNIWHSELADGTTFPGTWTPNVRIPDQTSKASPALAVFQDKLHMVHLGNSSNDIWHSENDGAGWTPNVRIPDQTSKASPALAAFPGSQGIPGALHMVHLGNSSNDIWHSENDGAGWTPNVRIPDQKSKASPALASDISFFSGYDVEMVHLGDSSNDIWHSIYSITTASQSWIPNYRIIGSKSKSSPALASAGSILHMVHLGDSSNDIWHTEHDRTGHHGWSPDARLRNQSSKASPALAVFQGKLHMVHLGNSSNDLWHSIGTVNQFERFGPERGADSVPYRIAYYDRVSNYPH